MARPERYSPESEPGRVIDAEATVERVAELNPVAIGDIAASTLESRDAEDSVIRCKWAEKAKEYFTLEKAWGGAKAGGRFIRDGGFLATSLYFKVTKFGLLKFIVLLIKKKGKVSFDEGAEIGRGMFSFDEKKEGKK